MEIRLATVVWGESFIDIFLRITARTLLAEGNLAALVARHNIKYTIYTAASDAALLYASSTFECLSNLVSLNIEIIDANQVDLTNPSSHWILWRGAAERAQVSGEILFFIIPDMIFSTGTLLRWAERFEHGYHAICTASPQVVLETTLLQLETHFPSSKSLPLSLTATDIQKLLIHQLHPLMIAMFRDSRRWSRHPDTILIEAPKNGVAMRLLASQPFCIDLNHFSINNALCPLDRLEDIAFEQPHTVCLEPLLKYPDLYHRPLRLDNDRLSNMGSWIDYHLGPADVLWLSHDALFHACENDDNQGFRRASERLGFFACQVRLTGAIYRVIRAIRESGCLQAAQIAAMAHHVARLRRHWRIKGEVTVFVPNDAAINALGPTRLASLLRLGREKALAEALFSHIFPGRLNLAVGDTLAQLIKSETTIAETGAELRMFTTATVVLGPITVDDCTIYVIDHALLSPEIPPSDGFNRTILPNRWSSNTRRLMLPATATIPTETPPSAVTSFNMRQKVRHLLHTIYHPIIVTVPGMRWLANRILSIHRAMQRRRLFTLERRAIAMQQQSWMMSKTAQTSFQDIQAARVALNLAEILRFYRDKMGDLAPHLPTLASVEDCLRQASLSDERLITELRTLTEQAPDFAEVWLELGYSHLDRNELEDALLCFDRCLATKPRLTIAHDRTACTPLAAFAKADVLEAKGQLQAAADAYTKAFACDNRPGMMHIAYGRLLRRLDRPIEALAEFEAGMETDVTALPLPPLPRRFAELTERLIARFGHAA
jgi:Fasciclin domain